MQAAMEKYPSIDEFLNSDYSAKVSVLRTKVHATETNDYLAWKSGMVGMKASAKIMDYFLL